MLESANYTADAIRRGDASAVEVLDHCLDQIGTLNGELRAFVVIDEAGARAAAEQVDEAVARGLDPGPFAGVPLGVKDLEDAAGLPTSHGSLVFRDRVAERDSLAVARLRAAGAVIVGKTAAPEIGSWNHTTSRAWGTTRNPWDPSRTPGGSSGGSAAAVSAGMVPFATASDGGGSIRSPAAFCGLVGLKPSFGRIPRLGVDGSELSSDGALTTTVADAARHLDVCAGPDPRCRTSLPPPTLSYEEAIEETNITRLLERVDARWSTDIGATYGCDPEVCAIALAAARSLCDAAGLALDDSGFEVPGLLGTYLSITRIDAWALLGPDLWREKASELEPSTVEDMAASERVNLPRWMRGLSRRAAIVERVATGLGQSGVLFSPTTTMAAFTADNPSLETMASATPTTMLANLCGRPSISVPAGVTERGLPVGLQIMGPPHDDALMLALARVLEITRPWPRHAPSAARRTPGG